MTVNENGLIKLIKIVVGGKFCLQFDLLCHAVCRSEDVTFINERTTTELSVAIHQSRLECNMSD